MNDVAPALIALIALALIGIVIGNPDFVQWLGANI